MGANVISSSSEIKQNPGFSFHSPRPTSGRVSFFPRRSPSPAQGILGKCETTLAGEAPKARPAVLTKVQENLLVLPLHKQLVVGQKVRVLLLLDLLDNGFGLLQQGHGY